MRTTITFSDDVAAGIEKIRRDRGLGLSEAVNDLIRAGLMNERTEQPVEFPTYDMGMSMDVRNIGEVIEAIERDDGPLAR
jgi:Ribbon-helix-helix protein, copG family